MRWRMEKFATGVFDAGTALAPFGSKGARQAAVGEETVFGAKPASFAARQARFNTADEAIFGATPKPPTGAQPAYAGAEMEQAATTTSQTAEQKPPVVKMESTSENEPKAVGDLKSEAIKPKTKELETETGELKSGEVQAEAVIPKVDEQQTKAVAPTTDKVVNPEDFPKHAKRAKTAEFFKVLPNGKIRYYEPIKASKNEGSSLGARLVKEVDTAGNVRSWYETIDKATGQPRQIRVEQAEVDGAKIKKHFLKNPETGEVTEVWTSIFDTESKTWVKASYDKTTGKWIKE